MGVILGFCLLNIELFVFSKKVKLHLFPACRSLFASKTIQTGDCILKVPYCVVLIDKALLHSFKACLAVVETKCTS